MPTTYLHPNGSGLWVAREDKFKDILMCFGYGNTEEEVLKDLQFSLESVKNVTEQNVHEMMKET
jgi:hypothetical protein